MTRLALYIALIQAGRPWGGSSDWRLPLCRRLEAVGRSLSTARLTRRDLAGRQKWHTTSQKVSRRGGVSGGW
jgi:hypothetical protein